MQWSSAGLSHVLNPDLTYGSGPEICSLDPGVPPERRTTRKRSFAKEAADHMSSCVELHLAPPVLDRAWSSPVRSAVCAFCGQRNAADILLTSPDHNAQGDSQVGQG